MSTLRDRKVKLPAFSANPTQVPRWGAMVRGIVFVVFSGALPLDLSGPLGAFEIACEEPCEGEPPYTLTVASIAGGLGRTSAGVEIATTLLDVVRGDDTLIVVGGPGVHAASSDTQLVAWLRTEAARFRRVCSVCTGAFVLAAAGLLEGRRVVTHWGSCALLRERHPGIVVSEDAIYERDGRVWTSAGVTAGIDLALALIEEDRGHSEAIRVARRLVVFLKRPGGQTQFSVRLSLQAADNGRFEALHAWIQSNLSEDLCVEALARRCGMGARSFARHYLAQTGRTPAKVVEQFRVEAVRRALEETRQGLKEVAVACGFVDEERMRRAFQRRLGLGPQEYRRYFSAR